MNDLRHRVCIVLSVLVLSVLVVACAESTPSPDGSTPEESTAAGDAPAEAAAEPEPRFVTVSVPAGTEFEVELLVVSQDESLAVDILI